MPLTAPTTGYWQALLDRWPEGWPPKPPFRTAYPVRLPCGRILSLPLRVLPGGQQAVASLIANQASFLVIAALADHMADILRPSDVEIIVGMPTLGLALAPLVAERLGQARYAPLGYSRKFWYDEVLSEPVTSITSPQPGKRVYLDPDLRPLLEGRRIGLVDDAISTGTTLIAAWRLLSGLGQNVLAVTVAMKQTNRWMQPLANTDPTLPERVRAVFGSPLFGPTTGGWMPLDGTMPTIP